MFTYEVTGVIKTRVLSRIGNEEVRLKIKQVVENALHYATADIFQNDCLVPIEVTVLYAKEHQPCVAMREFNSRTGLATGL